MCLAIPAKVIEIFDETARVDMAGNELAISTVLIDDLEINDFVIVHAGFAISKIDELEAQKTLQDLQQIAKMEGFEVES